MPILRGMDAEADASGLDIEDVLESGWEFLRTLKKIKREEDVKKVLVEALEIGTEDVTIEDVEIEETPIRDFIQGGGIVRSPVRWGLFTTLRIVEGVLRNIERPFIWWNEVANEAAEAAGEKALWNFPVEEGMLVSLFLGEEDE